MIANQTIRVTMALLLLSVPVAAADPDPIPDAAEAVVCGDSDISAIINGLPAFAGRCVGSDYATPILSGAAPPNCVYPCSKAILFNRQIVDLAGVSESVATLQGYLQGDSYCVAVAVANQSSPEPQCVDAGPATPFIPPLGPVELVELESTSVDLYVDYFWNDSLLHPRVSGLVDVYEPVDPFNATAIQWWIDHAHETFARTVLEVKRDGQTVQRIDVLAPFAGQVVAALLKTCNDSAGGQCATVTGLLPK